MTELIRTILYWELGIIAGLAIVGITIGIIEEMRNL